MRHYSPRKTAGFALLAALLLPLSLPAGQLSLSWTDNSENETGFKIERATDGSTFAQVATVGADVTSYTDTGLAAATTYWYRVRAYNSGGDSAYTNAASATTAAVLLSPSVVTIVGDGNFHSTTLSAAQTGSFSVIFEASPSAAGIDAVIGLSSGSATAYSDLAANVRFNNAGTIDALNGSSYSADSAITYSAGTTYTFRMQVDLSNHTYSVYVTASGGSEQLVGSNFAFRTTQSDVDSLDSWSAYLSPEIAGASVTVSGFDSVTGGSTARLINLSTRGLVNGEEPMITGFVVSGTGSQRLLVRAIGNTLADFGVTNPVAAPVISIVRNSTGETILETTGGWETGGNTAELVDAMAQTGAFRLQTGRGDAAVLVDLPPGLYSAQIRDASGIGGTCLVETYVVDDVATNKLINLSTRGFASTGGNVMIAGLVISGTESKRVLIRGVGPELNRLGVTNSMTDPQIAVFARNVVDPILENDDWGDNGAAALVAAAGSAVGAFRFAAGSTDAALVADLDPGIYSVHLSPASGNSGTGLVEVYALE